MAKKIILHFQQNKDIISLLLELSVVMLDDIFFLIFD